MSGQYPPAPFPFTTPCDEFIQDSNNQAIMAGQGFAFLEITDACGRPILDIFNRPVISPIYEFPLELTDVQGRPILDGLHLAINVGQ
jgi:hypothetical protein